MIRKYQCFRFFILLFATVVILLSSGCSVPGGNDDGKTNKDPGSESEYPRYTGYDSYKDQYNKGLALLQNSHFKYKFAKYLKSYDRSDFLEGEFYYCYRYAYARYYSDGAYEMIMNGQRTEDPDIHYAIVRDGKSETVYDFYHHIVAEGPLDLSGLEHGEGWFPMTADYVAILKGTQIDSYPTYEGCFTEQYTGKTVCGINCTGTAWKKTWYTGDTHLEYYTWVDPETNLTLKMQRYTDVYNEKDHAHPTDELYTEFEVTDFGLNCVTPQDILELIDRYYTGHEDEYTKMDLVDYGDLGYGIG